MSTLDTINLSYSSLSRKPADLNTTDIEMTAVRVFLSDGTHRTISTSPDTTCKEILKKTLEKLDLLHQYDKYGLQLHYSLSESRVAMEEERVKDLVPSSSCDCLEKIVLCQKSSLLLEPNKKRRHSSPNLLDSTTTKADNSIAIATKDSSSTSAPKPVNRELVTSFSSAWSVGTDLQQKGEVGGQRPLPNAQKMDDHRLHTTSYPIYTIIKKRKKPCLSSSRQSQTGLQSFRRWHPTSTLDIEKGEENPHITENNVVPHSKPSVGIKHQSPLLRKLSHSSLTPSGSEEYPSSSRESSGVFEDLDSWIEPLACPVARGQSQNYLGNILEEVPDTIAQTSPSLKRHLKHHTSEDNLVNNQHQKNRDSGIVDHIWKNVASPTEEMDDYVDMKPARRSLSLNDFFMPPSPCDNSSSPYNPSLAISDHNITPQHIASKLSSSKSIELLTTDTINEIAEYSLYFDSPNTSPKHKCSQTDSPQVPQRLSSLFPAKHKVPDKVLLQQGKRLSALLNLEPKEHHKTTFGTVKAAFGKILRSRKISLPAKSLTPDFNPLQSTTKVSRPLRKTQSHDEDHQAHRQSPSSEILSTSSPMPGAFFEQSMTCNNKWSRIMTCQPSNSFKMMSTHSKSLVDLREEEAQNVLHKDQTMLPQSIQDTSIDLLGTHTPSWKDNDSMTNVQSSSHSLIHNEEYSWIYGNDIESEDAAPPIPPRSQLCHHNSPEKRAVPQKPPLPQISKLMSQKMGALTPPTGIYSPTAHNFIGKLHNTNQMALFDHRKIIGGSCTNLDHTQTYEKIPPPQPNPFPNHKNKSLPINSMGVVLRNRPLNSSQSSPINIRKSQSVDSLITFFNRTK